MAVTHPNQSQGRKAVYRVIGSGAFGHRARSVLMLGRLPDEPPQSPRRALAHVNTN